MRSSGSTVKGFSVMTSQRREDYGRPRFFGHPDDLFLGTNAVRDDEHPGPELYRSLLGPRAVPYNHYVPRPHGPSHRVHAHRDDPELSGVLAVLSDQELSFENLNHRPDGDRGLGERRGLPRLPDVHARQVPLRHDPHERAAAVHYGDLAYVALGHRDPDVS